jgi:hypothetical protein
VKHMRTKTKEPGPLAAAAILACLSAALLLASCASAPYTPSENKVQKLVDLIDRGGVGAIKGLSTAPFILDGEILIRQADVDSAWANLKTAGFKLDSPKIVSVSKVGAGSYKLFGDRMELRAFFKKYLDESSNIVALDAKAGRYYLILNRQVSGYPRVQGLKGPVK